MKTAFHAILLLASLSQTNLHAQAREIDRLEPFVGSWSCKTQSATFKSDFRWILDRTFIEHDQELLLFGKTHRVKEIIGFDPVSKKIQGSIFSRDWTAKSTYTPLKDGKGWSVQVDLTRNSGVVHHKRKTLQINGNKMMIETDSAPLTEFLKLEFTRDRKNEPLPK